MQPSAAAAYLPAGMPRQAPHRAAQLRRSLLQQKSPGGPSRASSALNVIRLSS